jgi:hypothetical protein
VEIAMMKALVVAGIVAASLVATPASADTETLSPGGRLEPASRIARFFRSSEALVQLAKVGTLQDKVLGRACTSESRVTLLGAQVYKAIVMPPDATAPVDGVWLTRYRFQRCGAEVIYNALFRAKPGTEPLDVAPYVPGQTSVSPVLLRDVAARVQATSLLEANRRTGAKCERVLLLDTTAPADLPQTAEQSGFTMLKGETWTTRACGQTIMVKITFMRHPSRPGTTFNVELADAK